MAFTINIHYTGVNGSARAFMREMIDSGTVDAVRAQPGNMRYEYYCQQRLKFDPFGTADKKLDQIGPDWSPHVLGRRSSVCP